MLFPPLEARVFSPRHDRSLEEGVVVGGLPEPGAAVLVDLWTYPAVAYQGLLGLLVRSSLPVPRRDLDCARRILPCAEAPLRRDLSRPDSRLARRLRGTSLFWNYINAEKGTSFSTDTEVSPLKANVVFRVNITNLTRLSIQNDHTGEIGNREVEQGKIKKSNL